MGAACSSQSAVVDSTHPSSPVSEKSKCSALPVAKNLEVASVGLEDINSAPDTPASEATNRDPSCGGLRYSNEGGYTVSSIIVEQDGVPSRVTSQLLSPSQLCSPAAAGPSEASNAFLDPPARTGSGHHAAQAGQEAGQEAGPTTHPEPQASACSSSADALTVNPVKLAVNSDESPFVPGTAHGARPAAPAAGTAAASAGAVKEVSPDGPLVAGPALIFGMLPASSPTRSPAHPPHPSSSQYDSAHPVPCDVHHPTHSDESVHAAHSSPPHPTPSSARQPSHAAAYHAQADPPTPHALHAHQPAHLAAYHAHTASPQEPSPHAAAAHPREPAHIAAYHRLAALPAQAAHNSALSSLMGAPSPASHMADKSAASSSGADDIHAAPSADHSGGGGPEHSSASGTTPQQQQYNMYHRNQSGTDSSRTTRLSLVLDLPPPAFGSAPRWPTKPGDGDLGDGDNNYVCGGSVDESELHNNVYDANRPLSPETYTELLMELPPSLYHRAVFPAVKAGGRSSYDSPDDSPSTSPKKSSGGRGSAAVWVQASGPSGARGGTDGGLHRGGAHHNHASTIKEDEAC